MSSCIGVPAQECAAVNEHPVHLLVSDDLQRSRGTVFFRAWFALPFFLWLALWSVAALIGALVNWLATLARGRSPEGLHRFLASYVRFATHAYAYVNLAAEPLPSFSGRSSYAVDVEIRPGERQNRWSVAFRGVLALPAVLVALVLVGSGLYVASASIGLVTDFGLLGTCAFLGWFAALVRTRMPRGLRDALCYALSYGAQFWAYLLLLTDHYPDSDPLAALPNVPTRSDPVRIDVDDDLRRSRLTVFFRLLLTLPHLVWLLLWGIVAFLVAIANWLTTLVSGTSPRPLHGFLASFLRYQTHVYGYLYLTANLFPGFTGRAEGYPLRLTVEEPRRQNRWIVGFRAPLAIPALIIASAYHGLLLTVAFLGWFAALISGRMPLGLRNAGALAIRYAAQTNGYLLVLTDRYPYSGPSLSPSAIAATPPTPTPLPTPADSTASPPAAPPFPPQASAASS
jgi:hypothetical protein